MITITKEQRNIINKNEGSSKRNSKCQCTCILSQQLNNTTGKKVDIGSCVVVPSL